MPKDNIDKMCPLLVSGLWSNPNVTNESGGFNRSAYETAGACLGNSCAWWHHDGECCRITHIPSKDELKGFNKETAQFAGIDMDLY